MRKSKKKISDRSKLDFLIQKGKEFARDLRKKATPWELEFLQTIKYIKETYVFQFPVVCNEEVLYIIDFYFPKQKVGIELDGAGHYTPDGVKKDKKRSKALEKEGIHIIRFMNKQVPTISRLHIEQLLKAYAV